MEEISKEEESPASKRLSSLKKAGITVNKEDARVLYIGAPGVSRNNPIMLPLKW
jgi:hypothetical protein